MKQDIADRLAQAEPHHAVLAPDLDLLAKPLPPVGERRGPAPADVQARLLALRDEFVQIASGGRFTDAASREWRELPHNWRMALMLIAGVGQEDDLGTLASRNWQELPPTEREQVQGVVRSAKKYLSRLVALAARV